MCVCMCVVVQNYIYIYNILTMYDIIYIYKNIQIYIKKLLHERSFLFDVKTCIVTLKLRKITHH